LLEIEADPVKRQTIFKLIRETEARLGEIGSQWASPQIWSLQRGTPQITASIGADGEGGRAHVVAAKPQPSGDKFGPLSKSDLREEYPAVLHELCERLTATTNYLATALQLSKPDAAMGASSEHSAEISEKAFAQVGRANEAIRRLRQLLNEETGEAWETSADVEAELQEQKVKTLGQLTGGVAHDFNNLLAVLQGCLEMLSGRQANDQLQARVDMALQTIECGERLTAQLLSFALTNATIDLNAQLHRMTELLAGSVGSRISIETDLEPELWPVSADATQLKLALINLAINARDAMAVGGVLRIRTFNLPPGGQAGDFAALEISDTGTGMPPETLARAFEPFFTTKESGKGTGLGLSMVHGFAVQSGGTAAIRSEIGRGTAVTLHLPRSPNLQQAQPPSTASSRTGFLKGVLR
jgi:signal transduction histidine kinase